MPGRQQIPLFEGGTLEVWQRRDMLIASLHDEGCEACASLRRLLVEKAPQLVGEQVAVVFLGLDRRGRALAEAVQHRSGEPLLVIADRFARLYAVLDPHERSAAASMLAAMEWINFIQSQCEECGAPVDWA